MTLIPVKMLRLLIAHRLPLGLCCDLKQQIIRGHPGLVHTKASRKGNEEQKEMFSFLIRIQFLKFDCFFGRKKIIVSSMQRLIYWFFLFFVCPNESFAQFDEAQQYALRSVFDALSTSICIDLDYLFNHLIIRLSRHNLSARP